MIKAVKGLMLVAVMLNAAGCASYYSHYGSFSAQNSNGEARMFVLSWKTAEYPSWAIQDNKATEIVLETQCSDRKWTLSDRTSLENECSESREGIVTCGDSVLDLTLAGKPLPENNYICMSVTDGQGAKNIVDLESHLLISVNCLPSSTTRKEGGETVNVDYLKASVVPYNVATRKAERYSYADNPPVMNSKTCDIDS